MGGTCCGCSIMVIGVLTCCALLHSMCDLKATQMNMQCSLIWKLMLYEFKLDYNTVDATKNICGTKYGGTIDHNTVTRWFKKFCLGCKNLDDQTRSSRPKAMDSKAIFQAMEPNPANFTIP